MLVSARSLCSILAVGASASLASAVGVLFGGSSGSLSASANFEVDGTTLVVTLTNNASMDVTVPAHVLTSLFFSVNGAPLSLTPDSAVLGPGSAAIYAPQPAGGVVGGEWDYTSGISRGGVLAGLEYGIGSSGLGIFGPASFPGPNLAGPVSVNGVSFGLTSAGDNPTTGNGGIMNTDGLIRDSVVFRLSGLPAGFNPSSIDEVFFLYGTAIGEGGFRVPTPGAAALLTLGGFFGLRRRR